MDVRNVRRAAAWLSTVAALGGMLMAPPLEAQQQTGTIRGQITDAVTMRPLSGAQVSVVGTGRGGLANASGQFLILNVPSGPQTIRVELIGYGMQDQQVTVQAGQVAQIDFRLSQSALELDALVVTGTPGQTQRRALGNSVSSFQAAEVTEAVPVGTVQELLQGRTPGLTLIADGGAAGDGSAIRLRGSGSIEGRFEPVIYVDGIRVSGGTNSFDDQCGSVTHCTDALDFLNPNDIESVEVIKGPAASTLYGAEAAAGVIQIITKKGRSGQSGIQWTAAMDAGTSEWALQRPITHWNCSESNVASSTYSGCTSTGLRTYDPLSTHPNALRGNSSLAQCDPSVPETGVQSFCAGDTNGAGQYGLNLSARGGGELFNFFVSVEKNDEQGVFLNNYARRTGGRANFGFTPSEVLNFNVNVGYGRHHVRMPLSNNSSNSILRNGMRGRADAVFQFEPGYRGFGPTLANEWNTQTFSERYTIGATINYNPTSWLQNRLVVGLDNNNREVSDFTSPDARPEQPWGTTRSSGFIDITLPSSHTWTVDYSGTVATDINENYSSSFSAGMQLNASKQESFQTTGEGLVNENLRLVGSAAVTRADQEFQEQTSLGFYVQEQVGYKNRLFATAAVRVDDNSAFGRDFSLVVYPKAQLSYVISDEDFFNFDAIDQLKLRGAWGQAGNPPDPFTADRTYSPGVAFADGQVVNILRPSSFGNPDLKAETGSELELGFESSMFDGRMGLDFTFYNQTTKDALIAVPDPPSTGFSGTHFDNVGEISNRGFELLVTTTPVYTRSFQWDASVALSTNKNELVSFGDAPLDEISFGSFASVQKHIEGFPMGGFWGIDVVRDANGNPILDAGGDVTLTDEEYVGSSLPTREIGFTNTFTVFDNFRVFANLDYKGGHYQWCAICSIRSRFDQNTITINRPDADPTQVAVVKSNQTRRWIKEADFIKLRELSLTYQLPATLLERISVSNASLTLSGRNLWMWTKYTFEDTDGVGLGSPDPEVNFSSLSAFGRTDYASIPMLRTFSASVRFSF
ncbi:MAG: SusC/RagA family TonB-linked outer membrane protein [Longimicrobiales bacterium]